MTKDIQYRDEYSSTEKLKLKEFRERVLDLLLIDDQKDDSFLIRWLRARNLDVKKAEEMLRKSIAWRKENDIDNILKNEDLPEELKNTAPIAWCGNTKEGYPAFLCPFGRHDVREALDKYGIEACNKFNLINMEKISLLLKTESERQRKPVTQIVEIMDLEGYSYRQMSSKICRDFMIKSQEIMDAHYPEILKLMIIVNAPKVFAVLFAMLKPFIPKNTLEKIDVYGTDSEKWKSVISEKFPMDQIPPHWGGTLKGVDEYCSGSSIWIQGPSDMWSYMNGLSESDAKYTMITINARDKITKEFKIENKCTILEWTFKTENYDIGFQVSFRSFGNGCNFRDILPYSRVDSNTKVQEGSHICEEPGTYKFIFDNSYSLLKSKTLLYNICVVDPDSDVQKCPNA